MIRKLLSWLVGKPPLILSQSDADAFQKLREENAQLVALLKQRTVQYGWDQDSPVFSEPKDWDHCFRPDTWPALKKKLSKDTTPFWGCLTLYKKRTKGNAFYCDELVSFRMRGSTWASVLANFDAFIPEHLGSTWYFELSGEDIQTALPQKPHPPPQFVPVPYLQPYLTASPEELAAWFEVNPDVFAAVCKHLKHTTEKV